MQLMINVAEESPEALRLCAQFLTDQANIKNASSSHGNTEQENDERPLAPPAPASVAPVVIAPAPPAVVPPVAPPVAPPVVASVVASSSPAASVADEFDSAGVPFEGRIHQDSRNKKKDGTWKLKKNIPDYLVTSVMQELAPRIRVSPPATGSNNGTDTTNPAPLQPVAPLLSPAELFGKAPLPTSPPAVVAPAPTPPPTVAAPVPAVATVDPFRALVKKITDARNGGRITVEEVNQCVATAGAPSLQSLPSSAALQALIPVVEANIDAFLALR